MTLLPSPYLATWISTHFDLPHVMSVRLHRAYTNDVYLVETNEARFVLKVYGAGWRHDSEIRFETELLDHLARKGILVAQAVMGRNGEALQHVVVEGVRRQAVLFDYAAGGKPAPPFSSELYEREGRAVAAMHCAADDFRTSHERQTLDLATLVDRPMAFVASLDIDAETRRAVFDFGQMIRVRLETLMADGLDWGICHGDLTFDNLHLTEEGAFVWYDFDSGGYGWGAIDCQVWAALDDEWRPLGQAFLDGYREVRPLAVNDMAAAYLAAAQEIRGIQVELERRVLAKGQAAVQDFLRERVLRFADWQQRFYGMESIPNR